MERCVLVAMMCFCAEAVLAQSFPSPQPSPKATVVQTVGIAEVSVVYCRPSVRDRKVWGDLVPYGQVWRAGANENTVVSFSHAVKVEGKDLPAGQYGLHSIPTQGMWTVIFSRNATSWGSFTYDPNEDALRVEVSPEQAPYEESLQYTFEDVTDHSATLRLHWERLSVPVRLSFDMPGIVVENARTSYLRGLAQFGWQGWNQAANYCLQNSVNMEEAIRWCDRSIAINKTFQNLWTKAGLLDKLGKASEVAAIRKEAYAIATEGDINNLGYQYMGENRMKDAIDIFKKNVKDYPKSWNVYDSLAEAYDKSGEKKLAMENYKKALSLVRDETQKKRIAQTLQRLETL